MIRLVSEIESARRIRGAQAPWRRVRLQVRVTRSGTPGVKLPGTLKDRRLTVVRTTTAPESYEPGAVLNLSEVETAPLIASGANSQNLVSLEGPALRAVVDLELGAVVRDLNLSGEEAGTVARSPLRLGFGEGDRADRGGVIWEIRGEKDLWKAGFRRIRASGDRLVLRQKTGRDEKHVVRTLTVDPCAPLLVDRFEAHPAKKKDGKKSGRPDPMQVKLDVAVRPGCGACARLPERDRLFHRPYSLDPARAWIMWAGTEEFRFRPEGGFAAALGEEGAHVLLFSPKEVDWLVTESRRDHPAMKVIFARRRPPATFAVVHAVGHRIGFGDNPSFALLARSTSAEGARTAHVVACRRGARAATGSATVMDGGRTRELTLERREIETVGAVYTGRLPLEGETPGETVVRLGRETIRIEEMS